MSYEQERDSLCVFDLAKGAKRSERIVKTECMLAAADLVTLSFWAEEEQLQFTTVCC